MFRTAVGVLSVVVVTTAAAAVLQALSLQPDAAPSGQPPAAAPRTPGVTGPDGQIRVAGEAAAVEADPSPFTIGELHDGEVAAGRFTAFWDAEVERIRTASCPTPSAATAAGSTRVVVTVGATPPAHLGDAYPDYAPLLDAARAAAAVRCAA